MALGPDGRCVLCRRSAPPESHGARPRLVTWLLLSVLAVAGGALLLVRSRGAVPTRVATNPTESDAPAADGSTLHVQLRARDPRGLASEQRLRGSTDIAPDYSPARQSFEVVAPPAEAGRSLGVLIWISANPSGALPDPAWKSVLRERRLVWVGANGSGNETPTSTRVALAIDALSIAEERFDVDTERVFLSGFSGGAKTAFHVLLLYPDLFRGALLNCGIDYFRDIPARSAGEGKVWLQRMSAPRDLDNAKGRGVYIITGSRDMNLGHINDVHAALIEDGFSNVQVISLDGMAHQKPPAEAFARGLDWLASH